MTIDINISVNFFRLQILNILIYFDLLHYVTVTKKTISLKTRIDMYKVQQQREAFTPRKKRKEHVYNLKAKFINQMDKRILKKVVAHKILQNIISE